MPPRVSDEPDVEPESAIIGEPVAVTITAALVTADDPTAEETLEAETIVCIVVAATAGGAIATLLKELAPQRQEQSHTPAAFIVPVPFATAPEEPTAGAAAGVVTVEEALVAMD